MNDAIAHESYPDTHHDVYSKTMLGFWLYLLTDAIFFATLFATYAVLAKNTFGGPGPKDLFVLPHTLIQTMMMLGTSLAIGIANVYAHRKEKNMSVFFHFVTLACATGFIVLQFAEFESIFKQGYSWQTSAFLSAYFTLVGILLIHAVIGALWVIVLILPVCLQGLQPVSVKRLTCLRMFWQFINIVWLFIFSFVYLVGFN